MLNCNFSLPKDLSSIFSAKRLFLNTRIYNRKEDSGLMCERATCEGGHARPQQRCNTQNYDTPPHKHAHALPTDTSANSNTTTNTQRVQATVLPRALQKQLLALARDQLETWCYNSTSSLFVSLIDPSADMLLASESLLEGEHVSPPPCMHNNTTKVTHETSFAYVRMSVCLLSACMYTCTRQSTFFPHTWPYSVAAVAKGAQNMFPRVIIFFS